MTTDITWADLTAAGLDVDRIRRDVDYTGASQFVAFNTDDTVRVVFAKTESDDSHYAGWNIQSYALVNDNPTDPWWNTEVYEHRLDASEVPAVVRDLLGETP